MKKTLLLVCLMIATTNFVTAKIDQKVVNQCKTTGKKMGIIFNATPQAGDTTWTVSFQLQGYKIDKNKALREKMKESKLYKELDAVAKTSNGTVGVGIAGGYTTMSTNLPMEVHNVVTITHIATGGIEFTAIEQTDDGTSYVTYKFADEAATVTFTDPSGGGVTVPLEKLAKASN